MLETHISYVLLAGRFAFKIKKPVKLGFLDFSTLDARRFYCQRELALNRRTAPDLYVAVVPIVGSPDDPQVGGNGTPIEYAVQMREFPQDALLSHRLAEGRLEPVEIDALARTIARFHADAEVVAADVPYGSAAEVLALAVENFDEIQPLLATDAERAELESLRAWTTQEHTREGDLFEKRRAGGFVRACHGDLHLGNVALVDGRVTPFDCLEFNEHMRWSDVMADVGFLVMDLADRGRPDLAARFLTGYLETSGDYGGLRVLRFYVVYRAVVRAKVVRLRAAQTPDADMRSAAVADYAGYMALAHRSAAGADRAIVVMHGPAASGKTTAALRLVEALGGVRVRTDVERKRMHGLDAAARSGSPLDAGLYTVAASEATYDRVAALAGDIVGAGYIAIADGAFLRRRDRDRFRAVAADLGVPFVLVDCIADTATLRRRIAQRRTTAATDASEADLAVLDRQLRTAEPLSDDERAATVAWTGVASAAVDLVHEVRARLDLGQLHGGVLRRLGQ